MKIAKLNTDWAIINEKNINSLQTDLKFHLIKLDFKTPTIEKIQTVITKFKNTNRFIISDNIRFYNDQLKGLKKFYVENDQHWDLVTFFKKNNKVILNLETLKNFEMKYIIRNPNDVMRNLEAMIMYQTTYHQFKKEFNFDYWTGNVLFLD